MDDTVTSQLQSQVTSHKFDELARQKQQLTLQALAVEFAEEMEALEHELRTVKDQRDPPITNIKIPTATTTCWDTKRQAPPKRNKPRAKRSTWDTGPPPPATDAQGKSGPIRQPPAVGERVVAVDATAMARPQVEKVTAPCADLQIRQRR